MAFLLHLRLDGGEFSASTLVSELHNTWTVTGTTLYEAAKQLIFLTAASALIEEDNVLLPTRKEAQALLKHVREPKA